MSEEGRYPKAVLISDIHFSVPNLDLASSALTQARDKAAELEVPLVIAGDLNDSKAIIRGEVANRLIEILSYSNDSNSIKILIGNHDLLNERGEAHSLNFLSPYVEVIESPVYDDDIGAWLIPYHNDQDRLRFVLGGCAKGSTLIMHQGVLGADMGHYVKDSTSLPAECFKDFRVISGHYHKAQDIKCGRPRKGVVGLFSYIGSPYTVSFSEAGDGPKGYRILWSDGTLELVPTNLRKHVIWEIEAGKPFDGKVLNVNDLLWFKIKAPASILAKMDKKYLGQSLPMGENFKLEKIATDLEAPKVQTKELTDPELLDSIIDRTPESESQKKILKALWREVLETT